MLQRFFTPSLAITLMVVLTVAIAQLVNPEVPDLVAAGLALTAAAPLFFLLWVRVRPPSDRHHPVTVSAIMGLGCAMIMIGIQRFGDQYRWLLIVALVALCAWMVYQRYHWRAGPKKPPE